MLYKILNRLTCLLPPAKRLPFRYYTENFSGNLEPELKFLDKIITNRNGAAIDAGANQGLYSYALLKMFNKVYAFELNPKITSDLEAYNPGAIQIIHTGLSDLANDNATLYTPIHANGFRLVGWASLMPGNCPGIDEHEETKVKINTLDSFELKDIAFIKIDVEGHESNLLEGARNTIQQSRPVILMEVKDQNTLIVDEYFRNINYRKTVLYDLIGVRGSTENYIFLPQ